MAWLAVLGPLPPLFFVSVASKGLRADVSGLESTLAGISISVDSKGAYIAPELCKNSGISPDRGEGSGLGLTLTIANGQ
jgi:hypothetical protein